jgi:acyl-coenzyme A synthetase/AMP-(fatty) acid ligase
MDDVELAAYEELWRSVDPWAGIPARYNLGVALTRGQVEAGRGEVVALTWENSAGASRQFTYRELDALSSRFAAALGELGVSRGDRVLLRLPNIPEFYVAALGIAKLGAIFIPTSTQFRTAEIEYRLRDSGAVAVVCSTGLMTEVMAARQGCPALRHVVAVPYPSLPAEGEQHDFWELLARGSEAFEAADTASDDVAFIAYTSGTTGDPKGVVHMHRYAIAYDPLIRYWHDYQPDDVCACPAELGWLLPVASTFLYALRSGIRVVLYHALDGRFHPEAWYELIARRGITNFVGTPTIYRMLAAADQARVPRLASLRHGVSAGEPLPPDTIDAVRRCLGFVPLDGIGMSECMVYCCNMKGFAVVPGSCGRPTPGCEIRLLNEELREVPVGSEGVLCVRRATHPGMMKEYWNKPQQTAEIFRGEWYYSGDVLRRDEAGRFWFQGRGDDVIKASGYRISPFEVESCLVEHPAVLEAAVVASPDAVRGSVVKAYVVLRAGHSASDALAAELQQWVKTHRAPYKYPRKIEFVRELPKTPSGKIKRRVLRQRELSSETSRGEERDKVSDE